jgi:very-short-patch-repair endonuclease
MRLCRRGVLERTGRGVYRFTAVPTSFEQQALAACLTSKSAVASGVTAMRIYGFAPGRDVLDRHPQPEVLSKVKRRHPKHGPVVHWTRQLGADDVTTRGGIPVTSSARTLRDVASVVSAKVLDQFLGHLLATKAIYPRRLQRLATELKDNRKRAGSGALCLALQRAGIGAAPDSVLEVRALQLLRAAGLPEPKLQWQVRHAGRLCAVVDFAWPERRIALEVDGFRWHSDPGTFVRDRRRCNQLQELGWLVFRTTFTEVEEGAPDLWRQIIAALAERARADNTDKQASPCRLRGRIEHRERVQPAGVPVWPAGDCQPARIA